MISKLFRNKYRLLNFIFLTVGLSRQFFIDGSLFFGENKW